MQPGRIIILNLDKIKLAVTVLMVISLPFSESLKTVSLLFLSCILIAQFYKKKTELELTVVHYGFVFLLMSALLSSMFAEHPVKSLKGTVDIFYYTIPFFAASTINNRRDIRAILWSF